MKMVVLAAGDVGCAATQWLLQHYRTDIAAVVTTDRLDILEAANSAKLPTHIFANEPLLADWLDVICPSFGIGLLIWWPHIISQSLLNRAASGFFNTHPSLLPYNRGKHYNFWALVEQVPYGVSIHRVDRHVDTGAVIAQLPIAYDWTDTGGSLYKKAQLAMVELFKTTYPKLRDGNFVATPQLSDSGSSHKAKELEDASEIFLDATYSARALLNLLRARTFDGHPACRFRENGELFEVRVNITRKV